MKKSVLVICILIGYGPFLLAQKLPPIVQKLVNCKKSVIAFRMSSKNVLEINDLPKNYETAGGQELVKSAEHLYLLPQGTGRIYQLEGVEDKYVWKRIDSTVYFGYNFKSISFYLDSTFYSYGGHGFWNTNGNLRVFNLLSKEWVAAPLSETIYGSFSHEGDRFYHIDTANKKLFIKTSPFKQDAGLEFNADSAYGNRIFCLDIKKREWEFLGRSDFPINVIAQTPWGSLSGYKYVIDVHQNKILELNNETFQNFLAMIGNSTHDNIMTLAYCIDSTFYVGNYNGRIDSITLSRSDLIDTGKAFYYPDKKSFLDSSSLKAEWLIIVVLSMLSSILYWKYRKQKPTAEQQATPFITNKEQIPTPDLETVHNNFRSSRIVDLLDEREKLLLNLLFNHSTDERFTSIEEINRVIGVLNRSTEIQKRLRSDIITSINSKMSILHSEKKPVIDKQRSEFDKRSFEYFIQPIHMELVEKVIG